MNQLISKPNLFLSCSHRIPCLLSPPECNQCRAFTWELHTHTTEETWVENIQKKNGLRLQSTFLLSTTQKSHSCIYSCISITSPPLIYSHTDGTLGFCVMPKDEPGVKPATFRLAKDLFYLLSHSCPQGSKGAFTAGKNPEHICCLKYTWPSWSWNEGGSSLRQLLCNVAAWLSKELKADHVFISVELNKVEVTVCSLVLYISTYNNKWTHRGSYGRDIGCFQSSRTISLLLVQSATLSCVTNTSTVQKLYDSPAASDLSQRCSFESEYIYLVTVLFHVSLLNLCRFIFRYFSTITPPHTLANICTFYSSIFWQWLALHVFKRTNKERGIGSFLQLLQQQHKGPVTHLSMQRE